MELFQELIFTISISLIVSLLIAKLFSIASSLDVEEKKIDKEWIVVSEKDEKFNKDDCFIVEDQVSVSKDDVFGYEEAELGAGVVINDPKSVGGDDACKVFDEMPERMENDEFDVGLVENDESDLGCVIQEDCDQGFEVEKEIVGGNDVGEVKVEQVFDDDDWQGIETTELEKRFGAAMAFMGSKSSDLIDNEVKVELYGLHRVAIEGSCYEPQPMALKVSARANWNSWKRLENLGREEAMEQYIALLSQHVPDWMGSHASDKQ
uniref:acyl-CoA-binding domain-containing protein 3 n=1 Tax=Erigeron canadensis TaxID=72917 RepID=UPI001CB8D1F2|nr:acyl-CoA-binding domain-containing protein 3 [Erigeron canadensis]